MLESLAGILGNFKELEKHREETAKAKEQLTKQAVEARSEVEALKTKNKVLAENISKRTIVMKNFETTYSITEGLNKEMEIYLKSLKDIYEKEYSDLENLEKNIWAKRELFCENVWKSSKSDDITINDFGNNLKAYRVTQDTERDKMKIPIASLERDVTEYISDANILVQLENQKDNLLTALTDMAGLEEILQAIQKQIMEVQGNCHSVMEQMHHKDLPQKQQQMIENNCQLQNSQKICPANSQTITHTAVTEDESSLKKVLHMPTKSKGIVKIFCPKVPSELTKHLRKNNEQY